MLQGWQMRLEEGQGHLMWNLSYHGKESVLKAVNTCVIIIKKNPTSFSKRSSCAWHCAEGALWCWSRGEQKRYTMMNKRQPRTYRTCSLVKETGHRISTNSTG